MFTLVEKNLFFWKAQTNREWTGAQNGALWNTTVQQFHQRSEKNQTRDRSENKSSPRVLIQIFQPLHLTSAARTDDSSVQPE